jgi:phage terminase large subunit-like protein
MDGALPTLSVIDEYHRAHSSELYGLLRDGCVGRGGQQVCISTAGDDLDSPLGRLRAKAYAMPGMVRDGAYRHVRTPDFALHEFALDESEDRDDLERHADRRPRLARCTWDGAYSRADRGSMPLRSDSTAARPALRAGHR